MKYIDAEKLKAEIERLSKRYRDTIFDNVAKAALEKVYSIISSLQQEQPEPSCKSCGFYENNCPFIRGKFTPYPNKVCKDYTYSVMKEQPEMDLDSTLTGFMGRYAYENGGEYPSAIDIARHFYELGLNTRKV